MTLLIGIHPLRTRALVIARLRTMLARLDMAGIWANRTECVFQHGHCDIFCTRFVREVQSNYQL
jgi:hypothetical protein